MFESFQMEMLNPHKIAMQLNDSLYPTLYTSVSILKCLTLQRSIMWCTHFYKIVFTKIMYCHFVLLELTMVI